MRSSKMTQNTDEPVEVIIKSEPQLELREGDRAVGSEQLKNVEFFPGQSSVEVTD